MEDIDTSCMELLGLLKFLLIARDFSEVVECVRLTDLVLQRLLQCETLSKSGFGRGNVS